MPKHNIRTPDSNDLEELHTIWSTVFDDSDRALFFNFFYNPKLSVICEFENKIAAMGFLIPVGDLIAAQGENIPCAMIYAVATLPEFRGFGFGGAVSRELINIAHDNSSPAVVLYPANDSLFDFYSKNTSMREWFYGIEYNYLRPFPDFGNIEYEIISIKEYMFLRENLLNDIPHIKYNHNIVEYQSKLCELFGGGLYRFKTPLGDACAVVDQQSDFTIGVKELLIPNELNPVTRQDLILKTVSTIAKKFPERKYIVRTPEFHSLNNGRECKCKDAKKRYGMLSLSHDIYLDEKNKTTPPWYGLAFD